MTKRKADPTNESVAYWEKILREEGLDMNAGLEPSHRLVLNIGGTTNIEKLEGVLKTRNGRVRPGGTPPDSFEK